MPIFVYYFIIYYNGCAYYTDEIQSLLYIIEAKIFFLKMV